MHIASSSLAIVPAAGQRDGAVAAVDCAIRDRIVAAVADDFALTAADLMAPTRRSPRVALARQAAMYLAHVGCGFDFVTVGRLFRRDRTTVSHACHVIEDRRDDSGFDCRMTALEGACCVSPQRSGAAMGGRR